MHVPSRDRLWRCAPARSKRTHSARGRASRLAPQVDPSPSRNSLDPATAQLRQLLLVGLAEHLQEFLSLSRFRLVDLRHREADMDQHPVAHSHSVGSVRKKSDVDVPPYARDLSFGDLVIRVDDLDDLTRYS